MDAVVLAGARNMGALKDCSASLYEAGIEIAGRPMVDLVVETLLSVKRIERIAVVIPEGVLSDSVLSKVWATVSPGNTMVDSFFKAVAALQSDEPVLGVTSDIPLISPEAIDDFLDRCDQRPADIHYPYVQREINEAKYPGVRRTYIHLKDGVFTTGNIARVDPKALREHETLLKQAVELRKKPIKLVKMLGFKFVVKLLLRELTVAEIEHRVGEILQLRAAGVASPYPEVGIDVDKPSDLELARKALA